MTSPIPLKSMVGIFIFKYLLNMQFKRNNLETIKHMKKHRIHNYLQHAPEFFEYLTNSFYNCLQVNLELFAKPWSFLEYVFHIMNFTQAIATSIPQVPHAVKYLYTNGSFNTENALVYKIGLAPDYYPGILKNALFCSLRTDFCYYLTVFSTTETNKNELVLKIGNYILFEEFIFGPRVIIGIVRFVKRKERYMSSYHEKELHLVFLFISTYPPHSLWWNQQFYIPLPDSFPFTRKNFIDEDHFFIVMDHGAIAIFKLDHMHGVAELVKISKHLWFKTAYGSTFHYNGGFDIVATNEHIGLSHLRFYDYHFKLTNIDANFETWSCPVFFNNYPVFISIKPISDKNWISVQNDLCKEHRHTYHIVKISIMENLYSGDWRMPTEERIHYIIWPNKVYIANHVIDSTGKYIYVILLTEYYKIAKHRDLQLMYAYFHTLGKDVKITSNAGTAHRHCLIMTEDQDGNDDNSDEEFEYTFPTITAECLCVYQIKILDSSLMLYDWNEDSIEINLVSVKPISNIFHTDYFQAMKNDLDALPTLFKWNLPFSPLIIDCWIENHFLFVQHEGDSKVLITFVHPPFNAILNDSPILPYAFFDSSQYTNNEDDSVEKKRIVLQSNGLGYVIYNGYCNRFTSFISPLHVACYCNSKIDENESQLRFDKSNFELIFINQYNPNPFAKLSCQSLYDLMIQCYNKFETYRAITQIADLEDKYSNCFRIEDRNFLRQYTYKHIPSGQASGMQHFDSLIQSDSEEEDM